MTPELAFAAGVTAAGLAGLEPRDAQCRVVHFAADGARAERPPQEPYSGSGAASASARTNAKGRAHAHASASSVTSSGGRSVATSASSADGRAITRTYDDTGRNRLAPGARQ